MRLAICLHDGLYGCGTGAGFGNWRFLQCLLLHRHHVGELFVLPVCVASTSAEFDHRWHHRARTLLDALQAELLPVDNGTDGQRRYGGINEWIAASQGAADRIRTIGPSGLGVVSFDTPFAGLLALLREQPRVRHIHIPRGTGLLHTPDDRKRAAWERSHYAFADGFTALLGAISKFMRRHLETAYQALPQAIIDVFDGATRFEWTDDPHPCPLEIPDRFILCYGRAHPYKGQHLLIDALALLRSKGIPTPPAIIGAVSESKVNPYADDLEQRLQETRIDAVVPTFALWLRDLIGHPHLGGRRAIADRTVRSHPHGVLHPFPLPRRRRCQHSRRPARDRRPRSYRIRVRSRLRCLARYAVGASHHLPTGNATRHDDTSHHAYARRLRIRKQRRPPYRAPCSADVRIGLWPGFLA